MLKQDSEHQNLNIALTHCCLGDSKSRRKVRAAKKYLNNHNIMCRVIVCVAAATLYRTTQGMKLFAT